MKWIGGILLGIGLFTVGLPIFVICITSIFTCRDQSWIMTSKFGYICYLVGAGIAGLGWLIMQ